MLNDTELLITSNGAYKTMAIVHAALREGWRWINETPAVPPLEARFSVRDHPSFTRRCRTNWSYELRYRDIKTQPDNMDNMGGVEKIVVTYENAAATGTRTQVVFHREEEWTCRALAELEDFVTDYIGLQLTRMQQKKMDEMSKLEYRIAHGIPETAILSFLFAFGGMVALKRTEE